MPILQWTWPNKTGSSWSSGGVKVCMSSGHAHSGGVSAKNVHKALEASHGDVEEEWGPGSDFLGWHDIDLPRQGGFEITRGNGRMVAGATGVCREFREVPGRNGDPDRVSWVLVGHKTDGGETTSGESVGYQTTMPGVTASETDLSESVSQDHRQVDSCSPSNPARSITLQATADTKSKSFVHWQSELRVISDSDTGMQGGIGLVGEVHRPVERPNNDKAQSGSGCAEHNRCIQEGTGSYEAGSDTTGCMVRGRTGTTYQRVGTKECILCPEGFHQADGGCACASAGRQYVYSGPDKQDGGTQVRSVTEGDLAVAGLLSVEEDHAYSRTLARAMESGCGHAVSNIRGLHQLAADARSVQAARQALGSHPGRLFCRSAKCIGQEVCELEARPGVMTGGCVHGAMDQGAGLC